MIERHCYGFHVWDYIKSDIRICCLCGEKQEYYTNWIGWTRWFTVKNGVGRIYSDGAWQTFKQKVGELWMFKFLLLIIIGIPICVAPWSLETKYGYTFFYFSMGFVWMFIMYKLWFKKSTFAGEVPFISLAFDALFPLCILMF